MLVSQCNLDLLVSPQLYKCLPSREEPLQSTESGGGIYTDTVQLTYTLKCKVPEVLSGSPGEWQHLNLLTVLTPLQPHTPPMLQYLYIPAHIHMYVHVTHTHNP